MAHFPLIAVTTRHIYKSHTKESRDSLDRRWYAFFHSSKLIPLILPNCLSLVKNLLEQTKISGILLTGGGDVASLGGQDSLRDKVEEFLIEKSISEGIPLIGVCRGMQKIQEFYGAKLYPVSGHICDHQTIQIEQKEGLVNSYHNFGTQESLPELESWAAADDGVIKAIRHKAHNNIVGIMWHPERLNPFRAEDIIFFSEHYRKRKYD